MYANRSIKPRVLVIHTGGTIGMQPSEHGYTSVDGFEELVREKLDQSVHDTLPEFDLIELDPLLDSANLRPESWSIIASEVIKHYETYDGFIVLHGTDTMAYSASALSFQLRGLSKPVILTGSQIPLYELRNDALDNLITALIIAGFHPVPEVCIYFNGRLLRGNRCRKIKATGLDAFDSPNYPWLGQVGIHIELHAGLIRPAGTPQLTAVNYQPGAVAMLPIYPGLPQSVIETTLTDEQIRGVIIQSYGVGNLPNNDKQLMSLLADAGKAGKVLVNLSSCLQAQVLHGTYATSAGLDKIGIVSGGNMTPEAAYSKLHTLLADSVDSKTATALMQQDLCGELDQSSTSSSHSASSGSM